MTTHELVLGHMDYARKIAYARKRALPRHIDVEELLSAAYLGLTEAATRFKVERNVCFKTYSFRRIKGAIDDYLRSLGYSISLDTEDADTGLSKAELVPAKLEINHERNFEVVEKVVGRAGAEMLKLYFVDNCDLKEIGSKIRVSESRVCQLFSKYKEQIRSHWKATELSALMAA
jgi:RNA polymerase sigma factor (sigma-70 family)